MVFASESVTEPRKEIFPQIGFRMPWSFNGVFTIGGSSYLAPPRSSLCPSTIHCSFLMMVLAGFALTFIGQVTPDIQLQLGASAHSQITPQMYVVVWLCGIPAQ